MSRVGSTLHRLWYGAQGKVSQQQQRALEALRNSQAPFAQSGCIIDGRINVSDRDARFPPCPQGQSVRSFVQANFGTVPESRDLRFPNSVSEPRYEYRQETDHNQQLQYHRQQQEEQYRRDQERDRREQHQQQRQQDGKPGIGLGTIFVTATAASAITIVTLREFEQRHDGDAISAKQYVHYLLTIQPDHEDLAVFEEFERKAAALSKKDNFAIVFADALVKDRHPLHELAMSVDQLRRRWRAFAERALSLLDADAISTDDMKILFGQGKFASFERFVRPLDEAVDRLLHRNGWRSDVVGSTAAYVIPFSLSFCASFSDIKLGFIIACSAMVCTESTSCRSMRSHDLALVA